MKIKLLIILACFNIALSVSQAALLSPIEKQIQSEEIAQQDSALALLEQLVNINSGTANLSGIHQVGEVLRKQFEQLGFKTQWIDQPADMHRAGTLLAERKGHIGAKRLLLIGHLDTVFSQNSPFQHFERHGELATGPGVIDAKGGDVVILYALKALQAAQVLADTTITVVLMGDEEDAGKPTTISRKPLLQTAQHSDVALDFEWSFGLDTATIARRGISHWTIETSGSEAHSSEIFQPATGNGAIFELVRILNTMRTKLGEEKYLSFNPGLILGGTAWQYGKTDTVGTAFGKDNVIAKTAMAKGDLRFLTEKQRKAAEDKMQVIIQQNLLGTVAAIHFQDGIPAMTPTEQDKQLLKDYSQVSVDLGHGAVKPLDPGSRGAADISHIAGSMPANLSGLGPVGTAAHSVGETLKIPSLSIATQRAAVLIYRLTHTDTDTSAPEGEGVRSSAE